MTVETLSIVMPFRNWPLDVCEVNFRSLELQTRSANEIVLVDVASAEPFGSGMRELCDRYGVDYYRLDIDAPDKVIDVHLWNTCFNYGLRKVVSDLVLCTGVDRVFEPNMVECVVDYYNYLIERGASEIFFSADVYNLFRTPALPELLDVPSLVEEASPRGGYGYWGASREWFFMVRGFDETIRWYEDLDLARRAKQSDVPRAKIASGRIMNSLGKCSKVVHLANHPIGRKKHGGGDVLAIARRGRFWFRLEQPLIKNGEDWGVITQAKLDKAFRLMGMSIEEIEELQKSGSDPLDYPGV